MMPLANRSELFEAACASIGLFSVFRLLVAMGSLTATSYSEETADWSSMGSPTMTSRISKAHAEARRCQRCIITCRSVDRVIGFSKVNKRNRSAPPNIINSRRMVPASLGYFRLKEAMALNVVSLFPCGLMRSPLAARWRRAPLPCFMA